jgi:hypothetical protein
MMIQPYYKSYYKNLETNYKNKNLLNLLMCFKIQKVINQKLYIIPTFK